MTSLLYLEEQQLQFDIRQYDLKEVTMGVYQEDRSLLTLDVPGLAESRPSLLRGDRIHAYHSSQRGNNKKIKYEGFVHHLMEKKVAIGFEKRFETKD